MVHIMDKHNISRCTIKEATASKICRFELIRGRNVGAFAFWDVVSITARDDIQKKAFELQLQEKLNSNQLPLGVNYHAIADPSLAKVGNGGSTMHALDILQTMYGARLASMKVLVIHAGGYSQLLPNASILGKSFMPMPLGDPLYQMLEMKLITYIDFPSRMDPGVFVCSSDTIELFVMSDKRLKNSWSFQKPGITALAHPSSLKIGTSHGVFVLKEESEVQPGDSNMYECLEFLHKPSIACMRAKGAVKNRFASPAATSSDEFVYTDSAFYMDHNIARKLIQFYKEHAPILCEIDAYGDFLQALGSRGTSEYTQNSQNVSTVTDTLVDTRVKIFNLLNETPFNIIALDSSEFYHLGTPLEYLYHLCDDKNLRDQLGLVYNIASKFETTGVLTDENTEGVKGDNQKMCIMHSLIDEELNRSPTAVLEYCQLQNVQVGNNCIISNCRLTPKERCLIPDDTFLSTVCIRINNAPMFVSFIFNIHDDRKQSKTSESVGDLRYLTKPFSNIFGEMLHQIKVMLFPHQSTVFKLWEAKLFEPAHTMEDAANKALELQADIVSGMEMNSNRFQNALSMADILELKDIEGMLQYRKQLFNLI